MVIKWLAPSEVDESLAFRLLDLFKRNQAQFIEPDLLFYEVGNYLWRKGPDDKELVEKAFIDLWTLPWFLMPLRRSLLTRTLALTKHFGITYYDALFLATAERSEATLVTSDEKLLKKIPTVHFAQSLTDYLG